MSESKPNEGTARERPRTAMRALRPGDLDQVVAIDARITGRPRRGFFEKRLSAALAEPGGFIYVGATAGRALHGYAFARILEGEFGGTAPVAVLDAIGVDPAGQGAGLGRKLMARLDKVMHSKGVHALQTQEIWTNHAFLTFLAEAGFEVAPRRILELALADAATDGACITTEPRPEDDSPEPEAGRELDFSDPSGDRPQALSRDRIPVRSLEPDDLSALVRIDRKITARDRTAYFERKFAEALGESGIRVSLVAEVDDRPAGYLMARVDFGEFGRVEPTAVIDTIGVNPDDGHQGIGHALMSQLIANLATPRIERIRTEVGWDDFELIGFLRTCGFKPSQRLAFSRVVG